MMKSFPALALATFALCLVSADKAQADILGVFKKVFGGIAGGADANNGAKAEAESAPTKALPRVYWPNLESITGRPVSSQDGFLGWQSDISPDVALLKQSGLMLVEVPKPDKVPKSRSKWIVQLKNGDSFTADELQFTNEGVQITSPAFVNVLVPLAELRAIRHVEARENLIYSGPTGSAGWKASAYFRQEGGSLATRKWNANAELPVELPAKMRIDMRLRSTAMPQIAFWIGGSPTPRIETWKDEVVLFVQQGTESRFAPLITLKEGDREIRLTFCYDKSTGVATVYSAAGALLGTVTEPDKSGTGDKKIPRNPLPSTPSIFIQNRGANLVIDSLEVTAWDGKSPSTIKPELARVRHIDGTVMTGGIALSSAGIRVGESDIPLAQVREVVWQDELPKLSASAKPSTRAVWLNGTAISGELTALSDDSITIKPPWNKAPVTMSRDGLYRIHFPTAPRPEQIPEFATLDTLKFGKLLSVHGTMEGASGQKEPKWKLLEAKDPIRIMKPKDGSAVEVQRAKKEVPPASGALVFLDSGEVVRAQVTSITEEMITIKSTTLAATELPARRIRAVHWTSKPVEPKGFRDPGWRAVKGSSKQVTITKGEKPENDKVELLDGGIFGHDSFISGDEIRFKLEVRNGWGGIRMNLFVADPGSPDQGSYPVVFYFSGDDLYVLPGADENQGVSDQQTLRNLARPQADIRISFGDGKVQIFANETKMGDVTVEPKQRAGSGITFRAGALWGNTPQGGSVTNFSTNPKAGFIPMLTAPLAAKREALTVPRFRRDSLPAHLLVAPNGDLVRGRVEAATEKLIKFTSGLETMEVPRDRVEAVVWLQKPVNTDPKLPKIKPPRVSSDNSHWLVLHDGSWLGLKVDEFGTDAVTGTSAALGPCKVAMNDIAAVLWTDPSPTPAMKSHLEWQLEHAPEPVLPEGGGSASPLVGKAAPDFKLSLLGGKGDFSLSSAKGDVVVLDFWATWCGPCVASMPGTLKVIDEFKDKKVRFVALNQGEQAAAVSRFIDQRKWKMTVAMDALQEVGNKYGVEGIPHTVVVDGKGIVAWVSTGLSGDSEAKLRDAISKALEASNKP